MNRHCGFSLIELLVVLVILALGMAVVGPRFGKSMDVSRLNASIRAVLSSARVARNQARTEQREVALVFDVVDKTYRIDDAREHQINPANTKIKVTAAESEQFSDRQIAVRFFPDGSATGGRVQFSLNERARFVSIDWLTGIASLEP